MHLSFSWLGFLRNRLCNKELNANCFKRRCGARHVREKSEVYSITQRTIWATDTRSQRETVWNPHWATVTPPKVHRVWLFIQQPTDWGSPGRMLSFSTFCCHTPVPKESPPEKRWKNWQLGCSEKISAQGMRAHLLQWQHLLQYILIHGQLTFQTSEKCHSDISL